MAILYECSEVGIFQQGKFVDNHVRTLTLALCFLKHGKAMLKLVCG